MALRIELDNCFPPGKDGKRGPLPKQKQFINLVLDRNGPQFVGYYGGYGSGKSMVLCTTMITQGVLYGGEYVIARQFMPELRRTTMKQFLEILPKELLIEHRVADAEVHVRSSSGAPAVFYFVGLDEPGKLDSLNLSGFAIDETSQTSEEAFLKLQGRLRNPKGLRKGIIVGNPKGHDWVYRRFIEKSFTLDADVKNKYRMIVAPSTENVHLPDGYVESLLTSYSPERIQRDVMGSFDSFEGQVYNEFNRQIHVIRPFQIPDEWTRFAGGDHGYRNPAAWVWGAQDHDENIYIYREFYEREWIIEEICKGHKQLKKPGIIQLTGKHKLISASLDPSTRAVKGQTGSSDWDTYIENLPKDFPLVPARNDVEAGIDRVKSFLKLDEKTKKPSLFIFSTCENLISEMSEYQYEELSPTQVGRRNDKESPRKVNDHLCDALRYAIMSRPEKPKYDSNHKKRLEAQTLEGSLMRELEAIRKPKQKDIFGDY